MTTLRLEQAKENEAEATGKARQGHKENREKLEATLKELQAAKQQLNQKSAELSRAEGQMAFQKPKLVVSDAQTTFDSLSTAVGELQKLSSSLEKIRDDLTQARTTQVKVSSETVEQTEQKLAEATALLNSAKAKQEMQTEVLGKAKSEQHRDIVEILKARIQTVEKLLKDTNANKNGLNRELARLNEMREDAEQLKDLLGGDKKAMNQLFTDLMGGGLNVSEKDLVQKMNQWSAYKRSGGSLEELVKSHQSQSLDTLSEAPRNLDVKWQKTEFGTFELKAVESIDGKIAHLDAQLKAELAKTSGTDEDKQKSAQKQLKLNVEIEASKLEREQQRQKQEKESPDSQDFKQQNFSEKRAPATQDTLKQIHEDHQAPLTDRAQHMQKVEEVLRASLTLKDGKFEARPKATVLKGGLENQADREALAKELNKEEIAPEIQKMLAEEKLSSKDREAKTLTLAAQAYLHGMEFAKKSHEKRSEMEKLLQDFQQQRDSMGHEFFQTRVAFNSNKIMTDKPELKQALEKIQKKQNALFDALVKQFMESIPESETTGSEMSRLFGEFQAQMGGDTSWAGMKKDVGVKQGEELSLREQFARKLAYHTLQTGREVLLTEGQARRESLDNKTVGDNGVEFKADKALLNGEPIAEIRDGKWVKTNDKAIQAALDRVNKNNRGDTFAFNENMGFHRLVAGQRVKRADGTEPVVLSLEAGIHKVLEKGGMENPSRSKDQWIDEKLFDRMSKMSEMWKDAGLLDESFKVDGEVVDGKVIKKGFSESMKELAELEIKFFNEQLMDGFFGKVKGGQFADGANLKFGERYDGQIARILLLTYKDNMAASFPAGFGKTDTINPTQAVLRYMLRGGGDKNQVIMLPNETFFGDADGYVKQIANHFGIRYHSPGDLRDVLGGKMDLQPEGAKRLAQVLGEGKGIFMFDMGLGLSIIRNWRNTVGTKDSMASVYKTIAKNLIGRADITMDEAHYLAEAAALIQGADNITLMQTQRGQDLTAMSKLLTKSLWQVLVGTTKDSEGKAISEGDLKDALGKKLADTQGNSLGTMVEKVQALLQGFEADFNGSFNPELYKGYTGTWENGKLVYTNAEGKTVAFELSELAGIDFENFEVLKGGGDLKAKMNALFKEFIRNPQDTRIQERIQELNKVRVKVGGKEMDFGVLLHAQSTFARWNHELTEAVMGDKEVQFPEPLFTAMLEKSGIFGKEATAKIIKDWNEYKGDQKGKVKDWDTALGDFLWNEVKSLQAVHEKEGSFTLSEEAKKSLTGEAGVVKNTVDLIETVLKSLEGLEISSLEATRTSLKDQKDMLGTVTKNGVKTLAELLALRANLSQVEDSIQAAMRMLARENLNPGEMLKKSAQA